MTADIYQIAIDGPSAAGKSTIAKQIANELQIDYIDTGAMYRAVGYKMLNENIGLEDSRLAEMLDRTDIDFAHGNVILDGEIVSGKIRTEHISKMASDCSALPAVREKLVAIQRALGAKKSVIMDGRDIGTNVFKTAKYKFYLNAAPEERAMRRFKEQQEKGEDVTFEKVLADIKQRDYNDSNRKLNPLAKADDAIEIDTTKMTVDDVVKTIKSYM